MDKPIDYKALAEALVEKSRYIYSIDITEGKSIEKWWKNHLELEALSDDPNYEEWESPYYGPS